MLAGAACFVAAACGPPAPYVRYSGINFGRQPKPVDSMEILRTGAPAGRFQDLGTVIVTCPSQGEYVYGGSLQVGGCRYEWAVYQACQRASATGADGIHSIDASINTSGNVVSLRASVFVRLPPLVSAPTPEKTAEKTPASSVEERLKHLEKLKQDGLITPDEYAKKREEILKDI